MTDLFSQDWQQIAVFATVVLALLGLIRASYRTWFQEATGGCGAGCGQCGGVDAGGVVRASQLRLTATAHDGGRRIPLHSIRTESTASRASVIRLRE
jgi:hypothetical protein